MTAPTPIVERDRIGDVVGIGDARQLDEPDVVEARQQVGRRLHGEPRLADATDAGERDDADASPTRPTTRSTSCSRPTSDERWIGRLLEKVSTPRTGGKLNGRSGCVDLPDAFGLGQVAQPVGAEVEELDGPRSVAHERRGDVRHQDLATVTDCHDPRRPVHRPPITTNLAPLPNDGVGQRRRPPTGSGRRLNSAGHPYPCAWPTSAVPSITVSEMAADPCGRSGERNRIMPINYELFDVEIANKISDLIRSWWRIDILVVTDTMVSFGSEHDPRNLDDSSFGMSHLIGVLDGVGSVTKATDSETR